MVNEEDVTDLISELNIKISDIENKHELLRERVILLGDSFIKTRDNLRKEINLLKDELREVKNYLEDIKEKIRIVSSNMENFARKEELNTIERIIRLWEPIKFARVEEVKKMIDDAIKNLKINVKQK